MVPHDRAPESGARSTDGAGELIELGRIVNRHGLRGEVRVLLHNPDSTAVVDSPAVILTRADGSTESRRVLESRRHKHFALVRFDGVTTANDAEALIGCGVAVPRAARRPDRPRSTVDLIGCAVHTTDGELLGTVEELIVTSSNDVCVVRGLGRG
jgi:16S rRNA processing protein RimM